MVLNTSDLIMHFVDKYIEEKEKNIMLRQQLEQLQMQENNKVKTNQQYLVVGWIRGLPYFYYICRFIKNNK